MDRPTCMYVYLRFWGEWESREQILNVYTKDFSSYVRGKRRESQPNQRSPTLINRHHHVLQLSHNHFQISQWSSYILAFSPCNSQTTPTTTTTTTMSEEKHHHGLFHHHKDKEDRPVETYESQTTYGGPGGGGYSETTGYSEEGHGGKYSSETTDAYGSAAPGGGRYTSETTGYSQEQGHGGRYSETTTEAYGTTESGIDYKKEEKHHKHLEQLGELGAVTAGAYALVSINPTILNKHIIK